MSIAFLRSFKKKRPSVLEAQSEPVQDAAYGALVAELQRMPDRVRLLELLDDCALRNGTARQVSPRLCRWAAEALRAIDDVVPPEPKQGPREIAASLTDEERRALLQAAWAQVDDGDGKIKVHPGSYPARLVSLGLCQQWLLPATWRSKGEQRAISEYGITRLGLIVAMHIRTAPPAADDHKSIANSGDETPPLSIEQSKPSSQKAST